MPEERGTPPPTAAPPPQDLSYDMAQMMRYGNAVRSFWNSLRHAEGMDRREATAVTIALVTAQMSNPTVKRK